MVFWREYGMSGKPIPVMSSIDLEFTNICNNGCSICPRESIRRKTGYLDSENLKSLAKEFRKASPLITVSGMGDPLLHPQFEEFIIRLKNEGFTVGVVVNIASLIKDSTNIDKLIKASPNSVTISLPSFKDEILGKIYSNTPNKDEMLKTISEVAARLEGKSGIRVSAIITEIKEDLKDYKDTFSKMKISTWTLKIHSRGGNLKESLLYKKKVIKQNSGCSLFLFHTFITHNGEVLACCHDLTGETSFAHIKDGPDEILSRKKRIIKNLPFFPLCNICDEPLRDISLPDDFHNLSFRELFRKINIKKPAF